MIIKLYSLAFFCFICSFCNRNEFPEPTQSGKNVIAMKVNRTAWLPNKTGSLFGPKPSAYINFKKGMLKISIIDSKENKSFEFYVDNIKNIGKFKVTPVSEIRQLLKDSSTTNFVYSFDDYTRFVINNNVTSAYKLKDSLQSEVTVTNFDKVNNIISGTFWN